MVTLAVIDPRIAAQLRANTVDTEGLAIVCEAASAIEAAGIVVETPAQVLIVNLDLLGNDPQAALDTLVGRLAPELVLVVYYFAKRATAAALAGATRRVLRGPVTLPGLRAQLTSLFVRDKLAVSKTTL